MRIPLRLILLSFSLSVAGFAAAPASLAGMLYTQTSEVLAAGSARSSNRLELLLKADGEYVGLLATHRNGFTDFVPQYSIPPNGRWSFRRLNESTGELILDGAAKTLTFLTGSSGSIPPTLSTESSFTIVPYEASTPLTNCSNRSFVRPGGTAFTGFVVTNPNRSRLLVRAVGPGLRQFGVTDALSRPVLAIAEASSGRVFARNAGWSDAAGVIQAGAKVGAFALAQSSADSALLISLLPGAYVAQVSSAEITDSGEVLVEVYVLP